MRYTIFDIETDGLLDTLSKLHCLVANTYEDNQLIQETVITNPLELANFLSNQVMLVGHNIKRYDFPAITKLTGYVHKRSVIDTLALSWYLYPDRKEHGLESWGVEIGVGKPVITDWENQGMNGRFQTCKAGIPLVYHCDDQKWAAMVYLTPNAPLDTGTSTYKSKITGATKIHTSEGQLYEDTFKGISDKLNFYDNINQESGLTELNFFTYITRNKRKLVLNRFSYNNLL